ncbi:MAG TPA: DUF2252 family protein, partial [Vicinamibacteria bacterium]|nr:DUF2252 family protein [Vicinamibacteria bacterium]
MSGEAAALAARQAALDTVATAGMPFLLARKRDRMLRSAHAFFRGGSPLFHELLAVRPEAAPQLEGHGYVVGDMHLENVGAYRGESGAVVFDLNDFDDATTGPWRADVLRLAVSTLLAARAMRRSGTDALRAAEAMTGGWRAGVEGESGAALPREIERLVRRAERRTDAELLAGRAPETGGHRSFVRGERYLDLPAELQARVGALLGTYALALGSRAPRRAAEWVTEDAAWRVAGTGSLGVLRIAIVLSRGGIADRLVELKEARPSAVRRAFAAVGPEPADRAEAVVEAARALVSDPPRLLAAVAGPPSFVGRRLFPQEVKLAVDGGVESVEEVARVIGWKLGHAHRRGARE